MIANRVNMEQVEAGGVRGVFAYSPLTGERYSATPGDYWNMPPTEALTDEHGEPMILATEETRIVEVEEV